jgi:hypothetical protein
VKFSSRAFIERYVFSNHYVLPSPHGNLIRVSLPQPSALESLNAFYLEHRLCGELDGGHQANGVWLACAACEVRIEVRLEEH